MYDIIYLFMKLLRDISTYFTVTNHSFIKELPEALPRGFSSFLIRLAIICN
jgi:hypothetical protein